MLPAAVRTGSSETEVQRDRARSPTFRKRTPMACLRCRRRKIKCDFSHSPEVCDTCHSKNAQCITLSVTEEEALKAEGYTDESLMSMSAEKLQRYIPRLGPAPQHGLEGIGYPRPNDHGQSPSLYPVMQGNFPQRSYGFGGHHVSPPYNPSSHSQNHSHSPTVPSMPTNSQPFNQSTTFIYPTQNADNVQPPSAHRPYGQAHTGNPHQWDHQLQHSLPYIPTHGDVGQRTNQASYPVQRFYPHPTTQQSSQEQTEQFDSSHYYNTYSRQM